MSGELYCGVDLHSNNRVHDTMAGDGTCVWHRRLENRPETVLAALSEFREQLGCVAIESTHNWYCLADRLEDAGHSVTLANPSAVDQYSGSKNTNDDSDARFIADLLRLGILPKVWICLRQDRALRDLLRRRMMFVNARTRLVLSLQPMVVRQTGLQLPLKGLEVLASGGRRGIAGKGKFPLPL